ncbi:MAG: dihydrofolate reductase [Firmicutes bacterium]|nr:dihydrofolate reductase [Bacillota bacterium]
MVHKNLSMIAAVGKNHELGLCGDLVWRINEDLQFFRKTTLGHYIVMGRRTYDSLPPTLKDRRYLVIASENDFVPRTDDVVVFKTLDAFLSFAKTVAEEIFVIGGGMIYTALLPYSNKMILTEINDTNDRADVFFPKFDKSQWVSEKILDTQSDDGIKYSRKIYTRR